MPPKRNKGTKIDLSVPSISSWADEMDDIPLAPAIKDPSAPKRGDPDYFASLPNRSDRAGGFDSRGPPREELPIPTKPPFTVFVGNLDFETGESDLMDYFGDIDAISAKIIKGPDEKPKGFGYVEFKTVDGLKAALGRSNTQMLGRTIRVSVAEAPKSGFGGGFGGAADEASQWRRAGPLPPRSPPQNRRNPSSRYEDREGGQGGGFGPSAGLGGDVDWSAARGSKFAPSAPEPRGPGTFRDGPAFRDAPPKEEGRSMAEMPDEWRSTRPARPPPPPAPERGFGSGSGPSRGPGFQEREVGIAGPGATEETWSRGTKFQAAPPKPAPMERNMSRDAGSPAMSDGPSDWRSARKPSAPSSDVTSPPTSAGPPTRRALNLQPRTASDATAPSSTESTPSKASPFGAARAVDTSAREAEAAARAQQKAEERKAQEKAAAEAREKEKLDRLEKERAAKDAAAAATPSPSGAANGPRGNFAARGARGGASSGPNPANDRPAHPQRKSSGGEARVHPSRLAQNQKSAAPSTPAQTEVDADGFVTAAGPGARRAPPTSAQSKASSDKDKDPNAKTGFSFAAAARASGMDDLVKDAVDEDAGVADGKEDVSQGVKELTL